MKLAIITAQLEGGGAEKMVYKLASGLQRDGVEVTVIAGEGEYAQRLRQDGVEVFCLPLNHKFSWRIGALLGRVLATRPFDIIHVHTIPLALWVKAVLRWQGRSVPVVLTFHGSPMWKLRLIRPWLIHQKLVRCAVSADLARLLNAHHIPNGVDNVQERPKPEPLIMGDRDDHCIRVGIVSRLVPEKGIDRWLQALVRFRQKGLRVETWIVGDGPQRTVLERFSQEKRLDVRFLGWIPDPTSVLQTVDVFVLPSRREGEPLALLEAMGLSLPIVAVGVGGVGQLLEGGAGLLTESSVKGLVEGFEQFLVLDPHERKRLGQRAQERSAGRSWDICKNRYKQIYLENGKRA